MNLQRKTVLMNRKGSLGLQDRWKDFRHICISLHTEGKPEGQASGVGGAGSRSEISWLNPANSAVGGCHGAGPSILFESQFLCLQNGVENTSNLQF